MVMTHTRAKCQGRRSLGSKVRVQTYRRTGGLADAIALPTVLTRLINQWLLCITEFVRSNFPSTYVQFTLPTTTAVEFRRVSAATSRVIFLNEFRKVIHANSVRPRLFSLVAVGASYSVSSTNSVSTVNLLSLIHI